MEIIKNTNTILLFEKAHTLFKKRVIELLRDQDIVTVGIPGGNSAKNLFKLFKREREFPWERVHFFMLDERSVPLDHEDSNYKLAMDLFLKDFIDKGLIRKENIHHANKKVSLYTKELFELSDRLDILIVGVGPDSHMASLFPDHDSIRDESNGFIEVFDSPKPPPKRVSASKNLIKKSDSVFVFFVGVEKYDAFKAFHDDAISEFLCPVKILKEVKNIFVFIDRED